MLTDQRTPVALPTSPRRRIAKDNTIIVMVANAGVSDLLANFACAAAARSLDVSNVVVFTSDDATARVVEDLGMTSFDASEAFGKVPEGEVRIFAFGHTVRNRFCALWRCC